MHTHLSPKQLETYLDFAELALPRHTSYPAASFWNTKTNLEDISCDVKFDNKQVSLYFHVPYCESLCFYCACQKEICRRDSQAAAQKASDFIENIAREVSLKSKLLEGRRVTHLHFGGGTPSFLNNEEWLKLWDIIEQNVELEAAAELAIELDPRTITKGRLAFFRSLGFNRISLGVQDFETKVQKAINRTQSFAQVRELCEEARALGFTSINFDLIYGLPFQTIDSMETTLNQVTQLAPDRIAFYRLAVLPEMFKWQRSFLKKDLPQGTLPLELNLFAIDFLRDRGYSFIGLDHFAKKGDDLSQAYDSGALHRNFQGMTSGKDINILGFGPSAISSYGKYFFQNPREIKSWSAFVQEENPEFRSHKISFDDRIRAFIIQKIYSYGTIDIQEVEDKFGIQWESYFANSLNLIKYLEDKDLLVNSNYMIKEKGILGRLLRRVIAAAFDNYIPGNPYTKGMAGKASQVG